MKNIILLKANFKIKSLRGGAVLSPAEACALIAAARSQYPKYKFVYRPMRPSHYVRIGFENSLLTVPRVRIEFIS